jgi:hypothetical protein
MQEIVEDRLPLFSDEESRMVKGSIDYVGINHYTSFYMKDPGTWNLKPISYQHDWHASFVCQFWLHNTKFLDSASHITLRSLVLLSTVIRSMLIQSYTFHMFLQLKETASLSALR